MSTVAIIGAGLSGLAAANWLHDAGIDVVVIEARERIGGRTYTIKNPKYGAIDLGGSYVGPTQNHILRLAKQFGVESYKLYLEQNYISLLQGKHFQTTGAWPGSWNPFVRMDIVSTVNKMDKMIEQIDLINPWNSKHAKEWDQMTVKEFYEQVCYTKVAKEFFNSMCIINVAINSYYASLLWYLWYLKTCQGTRRIWETENGAQERKLEGGSMTVSSKIAEKLGDKVKLNCPVYMIQQEEDHIIIKTLNGTEYKANYVILAVPLSLQSKIHFIPPLPGLRNQLIQYSPIGCTIKVQLIYSEPFWRKKGLNGFSLTEVGTEVLGNTVDDCKKDVSYGLVTGFIFSDKAAQLQCRSKEERKYMCAESLSNIYQAKEAMMPVHYEEMNWLAEQYSGGCYTSVMPPGTFTRYGSTLREPFGRIYFAGTETATSWVGYMNGAVDAGERAAREILCSMGKLSKDKIYIQEPMFEEVPENDFKISFLENNMPSVGSFIKFTTLSGVFSLAAFSGFYYYYRYLHTVK